MMRTPTDDYGAEAALDFYKQLLRRSRPPRDKRKKTAKPPAISAVVDHLRSQTAHPLARPDATVGHLAVETDLVVGMPKVAVDRDQRDVPRMHAPRRAGLL